MEIRKVGRLHQSLIVTLPRHMAAECLIVHGDYVTMTHVRMGGRDCIVMMKMAVQEGQLEKDSEVRG